MKRFVLVVLLLLALLMLHGCMENTITEDSVKESLPGVDPNSTADKIEQVFLYFRFTGQEKLFPYPETIEAKNESSFAAIVLERLLLGPSAAEEYLSSPFPKGTRLISARKEPDGTYTVTMSKELLDSNPTASTKAAMDADLRLRAYSIVNTICSFDPGSLVQILVDTDNTQRGNRISPFLMGFREHAEWLEPLTMEEAYTVTSDMLLGLTLDYLIDADYEQAYPFFADYEGEAQKPDFSEFQATLQSVGRIRSYTLYDMTGQTPDTTAHIILDLSYTDPSGQEVLVQNAIVACMHENALWKIGYQSLLHVLGASK